MPYDCLEPQHMLGLEVMAKRGWMHTRGLMTGLLRGSRHFPAPLIRTKISVKYW